MPERRTPIWLWPNILSLDAPIVAIVWLVMFGRTWIVNYLPWQIFTALGLTVWGIYILDRIMDLKLLGASDPRLKERHAFHGRHLRVMTITGICALVAGAGLAVTNMPSTLIGHGYFSRGAEWHVGYIVPGLFMVGGFFVLAISAMQDNEIPHFRNLLAGMAFAYGPAMCAYILLFRENVFELLFETPFLCFGLLCAINISAIHFWEHSRQLADQGEKAAHELALTLPLAVLGGAAILFAQLESEASTRPFYYAVLISCSLLFILNRNRSRFSMDELRVLADAAMIAPFPIFLIFQQNSYALAGA